MGQPEVLKLLVNEAHKGNGSLTATQIYATLPADERSSLGAIKRIVSRLIAYGFVDVVLTEKGRAISAKAVYTGLAEERKKKSIYANETPKFRSDKERT